MRVAVPSRHGEPICRGGSFSNRHRKRGVQASIALFILAMEGRKEHWERVYSTKQPHEVSWTQEYPQSSLDFIHSFELPRTASILDAGGGDSRLADFLVGWRV
jgi:hypothetical protein